MDTQSIYTTRISKALEYINQHLDQTITIEALAKVSHFSSFHFQRIYKSFIGETPYMTVHRLRLEKAVFLLKHRPKLSLLEIADQCGFPSYENFSRQFKKRFEVTPKQFKSDPVLQNSRIYQEAHPKDYYTYIEKSREKALPNFEVVIEQLPAIQVAQISGFYGEDGSQLVKAYHRLMEWASKHQLPYQGERRRFGMSIDNIEATPASQYRYDFALAVNNPPTIEDHWHIQLKEIPAGKYATLHCIGVLENVAQAWDFLYQQWLPNSAYQPKHFPAIEEFVKGPEEIGWTNFNLKCRVLIEKI